jgi:septal ring factor EnvC (AmiA/AmiB activator)
MAAAFDARMALPGNQDLIFQDINPATPVAGFNDVPVHFRPVAYKFIQRALNLANFDLDMVFAPEFSMVFEQPQILVMQGQIQQIQQDVAQMQQVQAQTQQDVAQMQQVQAQMQQAQAQTQQDVAQIRQDVAQMQQAQAQMQQAQAQMQQGINQLLQLNKVN